MDNAAIFTEITKQNELRRKAQLPLLNMRAEMQHAVSLALLHKYREFCHQHRDKLDQFRDEVLAEFRERYNPNFGHTSTGRLAVGLKALRLFEDWIEETFHVVKPHFEPKNVVIYGADRDIKHG